MKILSDLISAPVAKIRKKKIPTKILLLLTLIFFIPVFFIYYKESVSFHFVDEYNNFIAGYFLLKGKTIYSQIFFQHQPFMTFISYSLQKIFHPATLYKLVVYHRIAIILVALVFDLLLVYRFRFIGLGFAVIFELTKYYLFGSTFLAESIIVYPLVYMLGLVWETLQKKKVANWEIWLSSLFTFFVIFMRAPYIPTALVLFVLLLLPKRHMRMKLGATVLLVLLIILTVFSLPIRDYIFDTVTVTVPAIAGSEMQKTHLNGPGIITIFIYPILILTQGLMNYLRGALVLIDLLFLPTFFIYAVREKQWKNGILLLFILGISNFRIEVPGTTFYQAFHMLVWYGLFIFTTLLLIKNSYRTKQPSAIRTVIPSFLIVLFIYLLLPANILIWSRPDKQTVFNNNYALYYSNGEVVHDLADNRTTFFVEGWDSLMYWQADQPIPYPYQFYNPPMYHIPIYTKARETMFRNNSPEFVFSNCKLVNKKLITYTFKEYESGMYETYYHGGNPSCLFIKKSAIKTIPKSKWETLKQFGYYLKRNN